MFFRLSVRKQHGTGLGRAGFTEGCAFAPLAWCPQSECAGSCTDTWVWAYEEGREHGGGYKRGPDRWHVDKLGNSVGDENGQLMP